MLPQTLGGGLFVAVFCLMATLIALFIVRFISAQVRIYARLENEKIKLQAELDQSRQQYAAKRATLTVSGPHIFKDPNYLNQLRWRMKVHNSGPAAADNVQMKLKHGILEPKDPTWGADYPYPVIRVGSTIDAPEHKINPNDAENYEIICGWKSNSGSFFAMFDSRSHSQIQFQPGERWEFLYEATSSNAQTIGFTLQIFIETDEVKVIRVN